MAIKSEDGIVIGNTEDKYGSKNFIARALMDGFFRSFDTLVDRTDARQAHEIGCGEGVLSRRLADRGIQVRASDFSTEIIKVARSSSHGYDIPFEAKSIYDLQADRDRAELVVCCEVLEHLPDPNRGLELLSQITEKWCVLSVPREPIWRALNMARGKYLRDYGNTPGHLQHWSSSGFVSSVSKYFDIVEVKKPLPWTMILCKA